MSAELKKAKEQRKIDKLKLKTEKQKLKNEAAKARIEARKKNGGVGASVALYDSSRPCKKRK